MPTPLIHIVFRSVCEVLEPVASGVLIIIIVFVPLLTLQGLEGKLFIPVALRSSLRWPARSCWRSR